MNYNQNLAHTQSYPSAQPGLKAGAGVSPSQKARSLTTLHISLQNLFHSGREYDRHRLVCYRGGESVELQARKEPYRVVGRLPLKTVANILHCSESVVRSLVEAGILSVTHTSAIGTVCIDSASVDRCKAEYGSIEGGRWKLNTTARVAQRIAHLPAGAPCSAQSVLVPYLVATGLLEAKGSAGGGFFSSERSVASLVEDPSAIGTGRWAGSDLKTISHSLGCSEPDVLDLVDQKRLTTVRLAGGQVCVTPWSLSSLRGNRGSGSGDGWTPDEVWALDPAVGSGKRGRIGHFSISSRRRMQLKFARLDKPRLRKPKMLGLTFPAHGKYSDNPTEWKRLLDAFIERCLKVELPGQFFVFWKLEPQKRGAPHFHLLIFSDDKKTLDMVYQWREKWKKAWYELVGSEDPHHRRFGAWVGFGKHKGRRVQDFKSWEGVAFYLTKYLGKTTPDDWEGFKDGAGNRIEYPGRFWGIYNRSFYDSFVDPVSVDLSVDEFVGVKKIAIDKTVAVLQTQVESHRFKMSADERSELPRVQSAIAEGFRLAEESDDKVYQLELDIPDSYHFKRWVSAYKQAQGFRARERDNAGLSAFLDSEAFMVAVSSRIKDFEARASPPNPPPGGPLVEVMPEQLFLPHGEGAVADAVSAYYSVGGEADV